MALSFCVETSRVRAQAQGVDAIAYLKHHQSELEFTKSRLAGPAASWLREEASKALFVFIGEEHDTREIPTMPQRFGVNRYRWVIGTLQLKRAHGLAIDLTASLFSQTSKRWRSSNPLLCPAVQT